MMSIRSGGLDHPAVIELVRRHIELAAVGIPVDNAHALDPAGLAAPGVSFYTAWDGDTLLGIAALRTLGGDEGEVKSMRVADAHLGKGVGRALLDHLIATARARGWRRLSLETGTAERFDAANALYARSGFVEAAPFGHYPASPHNRFMALDLT